jgi:hypothetical protein
MFYHENQTWSSTLTWLFFMMSIGIFLVFPLHSFKAKNKLGSNVCQPHVSIFSCKVHNFIHSLDVKPRVQTMIGK